NQNLCCVARLVFFTVGNEFDFFLSQIAFSRPFATRYPQCQFGLVAAFAVVSDRRDDAVAASLFCLKATRRRISRGSDRALLRIGFALYPFSFFKDPIKPSRAHLDFAIGDGFAVEIGDDGFDDERFALLRKDARAAQPDVKLSRMDKEFET